MVSPCLEDPGFVSSACGCESLLPIMGMVEPSLAGLFTPLSGSGGWEESIPKCITPIGVVSHLSSGSLGH